MVVLHHLHHLHQKKQIHQLHNPSLSALALLLVMPSSGTPNFNRRGIMKKIILIVLASILLSFPMNLLGGDFETPHEFKSGDIISAEMMNELFEYIKNANKKISASELIGTWSCLLSTQTAGCQGITTLGPDSLYRYNSTTLVMIDDGDNTYSYTSTIPNIFNCGDTHAGLGNWVVKNNILYFDVYKWGIKGDPSLEAQLKYANLKKVSNSKLLMQMGGNSTAVFAECDKQTIPPISPTLDNVTQIPATSDSGYRVSLAWTDNSTDETGFKVLRKDILKGSYSTVTTTSADVISYIDTVTAAGLYWYRVSATNSTGDSTPSKVITVDVE